MFSSDDSPELVVLHDSEDVIDPRTFSIYATYAKDYDYIQVPVFSLTSNHRSLVAATYMDEFAERHTREMMVRDAVGAMIPSAGVGTCMTKRVIWHFVEERGSVLMNGCVTEDYILGVEVKRAGFRSAFAAVSADDGNKFRLRRDPRILSERTNGLHQAEDPLGLRILLRGMHKLGWGGDPWDFYFFLRDRKGLITNFLPPIAFFLLVALIAGWIDSGEMPDHLRCPIFEDLHRLESARAASMRLIVRLRSVGAGLWQTRSAGNHRAVARRSDRQLRCGLSRMEDLSRPSLDFATKPIVWSKTAHEVPDDFTTSNR